MDRALIDIITASRDNAKPKPGDYPVNGLLYCGKCNKPKEKRILFAGNALTVGVMCKCQEEEFAIAEENRRSQRISINRVRAYGSQKMADKLSKKNFENCDRNKMTEAVYSKVFDYASNYDKYRKEGKGIMLWGNIGAGKTYAALCILNKLLDDCHTGLFTSFTRIADELFSLKSERTNYINTLIDYDAVVIDDLGAERNSDWMVEQVYSVVDAFVRAEKPMIITTNMSETDMDRCTDTQRQRIYSRILGNCMPVCFSGSDLRRESERK